MNSTRADIAALPRTFVPSANNENIPRSVYAAVVGLACLPIGLLWDISHHSTIGRDTFWTPAHIVIQLGGIVPALLFAAIALKTTFRGTQQARDASVSFWGLRAPLGVWVTIWGALAMMTSAPFDCTPFPLLLVLAARASGARAAATIAAATYMLLYIVMILVLPLFPAHPKLAPIYHPVDHMVPPAFPLLLIAPAASIDAIERLFARPSRTIQNAPSETQLLRRE